MLLILAQIIQALTLQEIHVSVKAQWKIYSKKIIWYHEQNHSPK